VRGPRLTSREALELSVLIRETWELKEEGSPYYYPDACAAIAAWIERWPATRWYEFLEAEAERRKREAQ
jgi:hypothetical protein